MRKKVTVVGAGNVGATAAMKLIEKELADVVLIDVLEGVPEGKALDIAEASPLENYDMRISGASRGYDDAAGSDIVIITAGFPRKPGMSRDDLLATNTGIVKSVVTEIAGVAPDSILIIVTNPLEAMCHVAMDTSGFPRERVIGVSGVLDSARFSNFISMELNVSVENVHAFVIGGHGDNIVPIPRLSSVAGIPIAELMPPDRIDVLIERTRNAGAEIVGLLKTGSAFYAPAFATVEMAEAILRDRKKILPCAVFLTGEYGIKNIFTGVPVKLGERGVEDIIELKLTEAELQALKLSARAVQVLVNKINGSG
jgi:malate dehydrogenase